MLIPSKYEDISANLLVIGSYVIKSLKSKKRNIEELFRKLNKEHAVNLDQYFNTLTFLWLAEIVNVDAFQISLVINDSKENLHVPKATVQTR
ncbi:MAG: hypothetical protein WCZ90_19060 [Melioribacteraceae bacterium]